VSAALGGRRADPGTETRASATAHASAPCVVVGIIVALPAEARTLRAARRAAGAAVTEGADGGRLLVRVSGVGARAARAASEALVAGGARALVSWGIAAGLEEGVVPGTLVLAERIVAEPIVANAAANAAANVAAVDSLAPRAGFVAGGIATTAPWADRVAARLGSVVPIVRGSIACPARALRTTADKRVLAATGAVAADMESAAVAEVAQRAGVPWLVVRAVADGVDVPVPMSVIQAIDDDGRLRWTRLGARLTRHPRDVARLPALARGFRAALATLRVVATVAGDVLATPGAGPAGPDR
jgi:adenosylhomocysteine nucleosidase